MCYIYTNQLKSAYLLAVKNDRINDIKKILRQAELSDQKPVKKLCEKKLALTKAGSTTNVWLKFMEIDVHYIKKRKFILQDLIKSRDEMNYV